MRAFGFATLRHLFVNNFSPGSSVSSFWKFMGRNGRILPPCITNSVASTDEIFAPRAVFSNVSFALPYFCFFYKPLYVQSGQEEARRTLERTDIFMQPALESYPATHGGVPRFRTRFFFVCVPSLFISFLPLSYIKKTSCRRSWGERRRHKLVERIV